MRIRVACLGAFRELGDHIEIDVNGETIGALRHATRDFLVAHGNDGLASVLERSVFAGDDILLKDHDAIPSAPLSVLPPVAGG